MCRAARRSAAGDRVGRGADPGDEPGGARAAARPAVPAPHRWRPRRDRTSPDVAGHDRLVLRPARRGPSSGCSARLAVFAGGCTLEAAEAVVRGDPIDVDDVFDLLAEPGRAARWSWPTTPAPTPATGCWRRSASTARNVSPNADETDRTAASSRRVLHRVRRRRAEPHLRAGADRVGRAPGARARQPARGDGLRGQHPKRRSRVRAPLPTSTALHPDQRRGGLRPRDAARAAGRRRASRLRRRAHGRGLGTRGIGEIHTAQSGDVRPGPGRRTTTRPRRRHSPRSLVVMASGTMSQRRATTMQASPISSTRPATRNPTTCPRWPRCSSAPPPTSFPIGTGTQPRPVKRPAKGSRWPARAA